MVIILSLAYCVLTMLYFGSIRLLDCKKKEFGQFIVMYLFFLLFLLCLSYILARVYNGEKWYLSFNRVRDQAGVLMFYCPPTFLIAYLLYPFKVIKRNRILIWILLGYTVLVVGGSAVLSILVANSNM